ncbi:hypothetical protein [Halochromatium salexigens]|uniref:ATP-binding protein n=1 Tax=Halochromatium salexigens TaxID=49447 RepID=A0AAJ0UIH7_HALSE|nr:hypothetical protein [Halochromatium salexigens]MBK5931898.1 hypothetical protein [Halochromatium salexigens]
MNDLADSGTAAAPLADSIHIESVYTRAINLARDGDTLELVAAYRPTSRARQCLRQMAAGLSAEPRPRALAAIGPYGVGKSAMALFAGALLSDPGSEAHRTAARVLQAVDPELTEQISQALSGTASHTTSGTASHATSGIASHATSSAASHATSSRNTASAASRNTSSDPASTSRGYLRVGINGLPDSLQRQLLLALALAVEQAGLAAGLIRDLRNAVDHPVPMDAALQLLLRVQRAWAHAGGRGLLIEIDELGKFLEYAAYHPEQRDLHLLQLLAEHSRDPEPIPVQILVLLHQAFEHYGARLGRELRDEWRKVQGRFETIAFLEPAEQALRVLATAFKREIALPAHTQASLERSIRLLADEGALPHGLDADEATALCARCYPLHPISLLLLPTLCQKIAQNERTLFSYLGSHEPFGLQERLRRLRLGDWVWPWDLYDYFVLNQSTALGDAATDHRWAEVVTALERLDVAPNDPNDPDAPALIALLKTIGLFNLIGAQRGFKASPVLLGALFGSQLPALIERLQAGSSIHFRQFSQDYRVWAGSDFDLRAALEEALAAQAGRSLADTLNDLAPLRAQVARRITIHTGNLRAFSPCFTAAERWPPAAVGSQELPLWFYLASEHETTPTTARGVLALCFFTERLREAIDEWMALCELPKQQAALHQDPVAAREHRAWLSHAEQEAHQAIRGLIAAPEQLRWFCDGIEQPIQQRRELQGLLSDWAARHYPKAPRLNNELLNRDAPSPSANLGRKRLIAAMLSAADQPGLGIAKTPAEKSLYLNLLAATRLHREEHGRLGLYAPDPEHDPCRMCPFWDAITAMLGEGGERQVPLPELYERLRGPPFGIKLGVLPVLIIAYLIAHQRDVALYQEGVFCDQLSLEHAELLCRRPELFALERFDLGGLRGELFDRYIHSVVGRVPAEATLLDIVRPLVGFINALPEYSQHCAGLSATAGAVRRAISQAASPGVLLFEALPTACGTAPEVLNSDERGAIEPFVDRLVGALRELKQAYPALMADWQEQLGRALLHDPPSELADLRQALAERYRGLDDFTPDRQGLGAFIRRLADPAHSSDSTWLESVATLIAKVPPSKWREETRRQALLRLRERAEQARDLQRLRLGEQGAASATEGALLLKRVDAQQGEISHLLHLSAEQRQRAMEQARQLAAHLGDIGPNEQLAVIAAFLEQLEPDNAPDDHQEDE